MPNPLLTMRDIAQEIELQSIANRCLLKRRIDGWEAYNTDANIFAGKIPELIIKLRGYNRAKDVSGISIATVVADVKAAFATEGIVINCNLDQARSFDIDDGIIVLIYNLTEILFWHIDYTLDF
jgi:hypothetical protein